MSAKTSKRGAPAGPAADEGFDAVMGRLREVVEQLERGDLPLEASLAAYEQGVALARRGQGLLDAAEQRIELLRQGDDTPRAVETDGNDDDDESDDDR